LLSALLGSVMVASTTGLPLHHEADHEGDVAHVERHHGGHGAELVEQDGQLLSKTFNLSATAALQALSFGEPLPGIEAFLPSQSPAHHGRDPPRESRPRAPPA
jgi:hypothetical protein